MTELQMMADQIRTMKARILQIKSESSDMVRHRDLDCVVGACNGLLECLEDAHE